MVRPKRYKTYDRAFEEAEDYAPDVPESTVRSRKKRKLDQHALATGCNSAS